MIITLEPNQGCARGIGDFLKRLGHVGFKLILIGALFVLLQGAIVQAQPLSRPLKSALETSFWYSFSNVEMLLLNSGLGIENDDPRLFEDDELVRSLKLKDRFPLRAPYLSGIPVFAQEPDENDPHTLRWTDASVNEETTLETLSYTILAELSWASRLNQLAGGESGQASTFARHQTQLFTEMAIATAAFVEDRMKREDGFYWHSLRWWQDIVIQDEADDWRGHLAWLWALSAMMAFDQTNGSVDFPFAKLGHDLFQNLKDTVEWNRLSVEDASLAVKALSWFLVFCKDGLDQAEAIERLNAVLDTLAQAAQESQPSSTQAAIISGLLQGSHLLGDSYYQTTALKVWQQLANRWDDQWSVFADDESLFPLDLMLYQVSEYLAAFHMLIHIVDDETAKELYPKFFETLNRSGLQGAEVTQASSRGSSSNEEKVAPVFVSHVRLTGQRWEVIDGRFRSTEALNASNWLLWISQFQGESFAGPPALGLPEDEAIRQNQVPRRLQTLANSLKEAQQQIAELTQQLAAIGQSNGNTTSNNTTNAPTQEAFDQLASDVSEFQEQITNELQALKNSVATNGSSNTGNMSDGATQQALDQLASDVSAFQERITNELQALKDTVSEGNGSTGVDDGQLANLQTQINEIQNQLDQLTPIETQFNQLVELVSNQEQDMAVLEERLADLQTELTAEVQQFISDFEGKSNTDVLEGQLAQLERDLKSKFDPLSESLARFDQQLAQLNSFQQNINQLGTDIAQLELRLNSIELTDSTPGTPINYFQPEFVLTGILLIGIAFVAIGLFRLRRQREIIEAANQVISDATTPGSATSRLP